jgi:hypothetical protein
MALPSLPEILTAAGAARLDPAHAVWTLNDPFWPVGEKARHVRNGKRDILAWLFRHEPPAFLVIDGHDLMREVPRASETGVKDTWQLDPTIQPADLDARILYLGLWSLYTAPEPIDPGAFRDGDPRHARDMASTLERLRLTFLISSGYDDDPWQIALADRLWVSGPAAE